MVETTTACRHCTWWSQPRRPRETLWLLGCEWDVDQAYNLMKGRQPIEVSTSQLSSVVDYPPNPEGVDLLGLKRAVDVGHLDHIDPTKPVVVGRAPLGVGGKVISILLDGSHRIARAVRDRVRVVPTFLLSEDETASCYCGDPRLNPHRVAEEKETVRSRRSR